jgi:hypothetical protein
VILYFGPKVSVVIDRSVETIGEGCFTKHDAFVSISFESHSVLERIGEWTFASGKLTGEIVLPRSVRVFAGSCFSRDGSLISVIFESGSVLSEIGKYAFACSGLRSIVLPASVRVIGDWAFGSGEKRTEPEGLHCGNRTFSEIAIV